MLNQGKVTQQTLADVATHTLWRFTRIAFSSFLGKWGRQFYSSL